MMTIATIETPTRYGASFGKHKEIDTLMGLKSHDYHCMIQQIIPVCVRGNIPPAQQTTLIILGKVFTYIFAKVQVKGDLEILQQYVVETLCILEVCFPPALFDSMAHLVVHLMLEIALCGPETRRWSYSLERGLKPPCQMVICGWKLLGSVHYNWGRTHILIRGCGTARRT